MTIALNRNHTSVTAADVGERLSPNAVRMVAFACYSPRLNVQIRRARDGARRFHLLEVNESAA